MPVTQQMLEEFVLKSNFVGNVTLVVEITPFNSKVNSKRALTRLLHHNLYFFFPL